MKLCLLLFSFYFTNLLVGQTSTLGRLSSELKEISGLERLSDTTLFAINDGGNDPCVYIINLKGKIIRSVYLTNVKNRDWEDLAIDETGTYLYIGEIGNNQNKHKKLAINKVKISDLLSKDVVEAERITFQYPNQFDFPPDKSELFFDCEAMTIAHERMFFFTKSNSKPYKGTSYVYSMKLDGSDFQMESTIEFGDDGYYKNSITAADYHNGKFYLSSYSFVYVMRLDKEGFKLLETHSYNRLTQKESLVVMNEHELIIADEKSPLMIGQNLYRFKLKK